MLQRRLTAPGFVFGPVLDPGIGLGPAVDIAAVGADEFMAVEIALEEGFVIHGQPRKNERLRLGAAYQNRSHDLLPMGKRLLNRAKLTSG